MATLDTSTQTVVEVQVEGAQGPAGPAVDPSNVVSKGGSFTYTSNEAYALVKVTAAAVITLPADAPVGAGFMVLQTGSGAVSFVAGAGATLTNDLGNTKIYGQWSVVSAMCHASGVWTIAGATKA